MNTENHRKLSEPVIHLKEKDASDSILPKDWDPVLAADRVMSNLMRVTASHVKGAHDAEFVCVGEHAYIVEHDNDVQPGHAAGDHQYCVLTIVNMSTMVTEQVIPFARSEQVFDNFVLPKGMCFVPRILQINDRTLRCFFASQPAESEAQTWYRDFYLDVREFDAGIYKARLKTKSGTFDMQPQYLHEDAAREGFERPACKYGMYLFDSFKKFDNRIYVAMNNFPGRQNALALMHDDCLTFEVLGHYNEPQSQMLSESSVNRLPNGTWMAICRNDSGNYHFSFSHNGCQWTRGREQPLVTRGENSKPTFDCFGGVYYLGWQEATPIDGGRRSVFNLDVSRDGISWERKYRFQSADSFQYPTFHQHAGSIWLTVTQGEKGSTDRILFGKLEDGKEHHATSPS
jgi:hypothetical protein